MRVIESVEEMSKQSWLVCTVIINRIYACTCMFVRRMKKCNNMRQIVSYSFFFPILYLVWLNSGNEVTGLCSSPWAPALWRFVVNVGREGGTEMPEAWGVSGARLAFSLDVIAQPDRDEKEPEWRCLTLPEGEEVNFVSNEGVQSVRIRKGGWNMELPPNGGNKKGIATKLNLWLDLENDLKRNDVE